MPASSNSGRRIRRKAKANCRADRHRYGSEQPIGGGITRRVCLACGAVSIDLTGADGDMSIGLFKERTAGPEPQS